MVGYVVNEGLYGGYVVNRRPCGWVRGKWKGGYMVNGRVGTW